MHHYVNILLWYEVTWAKPCTTIWELKGVGCRLVDRRGEGVGVTFASYYPQGRLLPVKYT